MLGEGFIVGNYETLLTTDNFYLVRVWRTLPETKTSKDDVTSPERSRPELAVASAIAAASAASGLAFNALHIPKITSKRKVPTKTKSVQRNKKTITKTKQEYKNIFSISNAQIVKETQRIKASLNEIYFSDSQVRGKLLIDQSHDVRDLCVNQRRDERIKPMSFYTTSGKQVTKTDTFAFIALSNGAVLSPHHNGLLLIYSENNRRFAFGCFDGWKLLDTNEETKQSGLRITCTWLVTSSASHTNQQLAYVPIENVLVSANMLPYALKAHLAPDQMLSLNALETTTTPCKRKTCHGIDDIGCAYADLYDYLEFYHVRQNWIFRTALGHYIYKTFIKPVLVGLYKSVPNQIFATAIQNGTATYDKCYQSCVCDLCGDYVHQIWRVIGSHKELFRIGVACCYPLFAFLENIGCAIYEFRTKANFELSIALNLLPCLLKLQTEYNTQKT